MPLKSKPTAPSEGSTATIGFEAKLWLTADKLRYAMDAVEPSEARYIAFNADEVCVLNHCQLK